MPRERAIPVMGSGDAGPWECRAGWGGCELTPACCIPLGCLKGAWPHPCPGRAGRLVDVGPPQGHREGWPTARDCPYGVPVPVCLSPRMGEFSDKNATCGTICLKYLLFAFNCCFWVRDISPPCLGVSWPSSPPQPCSPALEASSLVTTLITHSWLAWPLWLWASGRWSSRVTTSACWLQAFTWPQPTSWWWPVWLLWSPGSWAAAPPSRSAGTCCGWSAGAGVARGSGEGTPQCRGAAGLMH